MTEVQEILSILEGFRKDQTDSLLNKANLYLLHQGDRSNSIRIQEDGKEAKLKSITITNLQAKYVGFKPDGIPPNKRKFWINPMAKSVNEAIDGLIFLEYNQKGYVILCELKSSLPPESEYINKFKGILCFLDYLNAILREFYGKDFHTYFQKKLVVFYHKKAALSSIGSKKIGNNIVQMKGFSHSNSEISIETLV